MAAQLRRRGRDDFVILEKAHDVGGTWRDNTYPGCALRRAHRTVLVFLRARTRMVRDVVAQPEIQAYLRRVADKYDLRPRHFGTELVEATGTRRPRVGGRDWRRAHDYVAQFVVIGVAPLHVPHPGTSGIGLRRAAFHSARWDHDYDLTGKKVAVIGTGASAVQFVPHIAAQAEQPAALSAHSGLGDRPPNPIVPHLVHTGLRPGARRVTRVPRHQLLDRRTRWRW